MEALETIEWNWEDMCGPSGLQPWNRTTKDIGICFQELFINIPVLFLIAITSAYYVGLRRNWVMRGKLQESCITIRSLVSLTLATLPVIKMYILLTSKDIEIHAIDYFLAGSACLAWLMHFGYTLALKHRLGINPRGPILMIMLWIMDVVLNIVSLRSRLLLGLSFAFNVAVLLCHIIYGLTLIPSEGQCSPTFYSPCLVGSQYSRIRELQPLLEQEYESVLGTAMQDNSFCSKLFFCWVEPLFQRGVEKKLQQPDDLFDLPPEYRCGYIGHKMDKALIGNVDKYQHNIEQSSQPFLRSSGGYGSVGQTSASLSRPAAPVPPPPVLLRPARRHNVSLFRALHACFAVRFYSVGLLKFVADSAGFAGPLLLNLLVKFVQDPTVDVRMGYVYAGGMLGFAVLSAMCNAHFNLQMSLLGLRMRAAVMATVLRKTCSVSATELGRCFTVGEITNFMSTDTDRIVNSCPSFHALWSIPLQMFVTLFLLYQQVGISFLAGVGFSVLLIPVNKLLAGKIARLSAELMRHKDARVSLMSEVVAGARAIKLHAWEDYFVDRISEVRAQELRYLKWRKYLDAVCVVFWATTPVLVSALTLGTYALLGRALDAATVFTAVALTNMLIAPLNAFPWVLNGLAEAWVSVKRIQRLLELPDLDEEQYYDKIDTNNDEENVIILKNATFSWAKVVERPKAEPKKSKNKGKSKKSKVHVQKRDSESSNEVMFSSNEPFTLHNINLEIRRGHLIGVVGRVGSGKSSLLHAIIAEMGKKDGRIEILDSLNGFGYVSQTAWLQRGTLRDNVLFGRPYEEARFRTVVDACALTEDLQLLGRHAAVGEGGHTLSGGQRARLALARAIYQDKQVYILDDVLSAVDPKVAAHIFRKAILGLLADKTRILVTHSLHFLNHANWIVLMENGSIRAQGLPDLILPEVEEMTSDTEDSEHDRPAARSPERHVDFDRISLVEDMSNISTHSVMQDEGMASGTIGLWVLGMYMRAVGWALVVAILLSLFLMQASQNVVFLWLSYWVSSGSHNTTNVYPPSPHSNVTLLERAYETVDSAVHRLLNRSDVTQMLPSLTEGLDDVGHGTGFFLSIYVGLAGVNLLFTVMRAFLFAYGGVRAATRIHKKLLKVITRARMKFFDVTPAGRILNRFSSDTYTVDDSLPFIFNILLAQLFGLVGSIVVTVWGLPWVLAVVAVLAPLYHWLQHRYRHTSRHLKRLHSTTLSPIYSHLADTLQGMTTIRALKATARATSCAEELVDLSQRAALSSAAAAQWLALRLQAIGVVVLAGAALAAVLQRHYDAVDAGLVGLAISYALSLTSLLSGVMNAFPETEREMVAVERIGEYIKEVEPEPLGAGELPPYGWPTHGVIRFEGVVMKYREHTRPALQGVTFECRPMEKVGVVGRTGAGKSSLLAALLRLCPLSAGTVTLDSVSLASLSLQTIRSRIAVIPQEPFIFSGSVRENVDPLRQYGDGEVWRALERCGARPLVQARGGLGADVAAARLSRGHMQLLCLVRALLHNAKVLCIDEATANVDQETDRLIQETIRASFRQSTVITIAHRISTILDSDRVLVMGDGQVLEFDTPDALLQNTDSHFYKLVNAEGVQ